MEPVLSELSLVPCRSLKVGERIQHLARTLKALDELGAEPVLRTVADAPDRDLGAGRGLRSWCFDAATPKDAGRYVAGRLGRAPYLDGVGGLFTDAEGSRAIGATIANIESYSAGFVALTEGLLVLLYCPVRAPQSPVVVELQILTDDGHEVIRQVEVLTLDSADDVKLFRQHIEESVERTVQTGDDLVRRFESLCPCVVLGAGALKQLRTLTGNEPFFPQVVRHLRALNRAAATWTQGTFAPEGVTYSVESQATLQHGTYGPQRDFATPDGFEGGRWTLHTKLTGSPGARLYYKTAQFAVGQHARTAKIRVAVGYLGPHLDTAKFN